MKTEVHAPGFYGFALQSLLHARYRAQCLIMKKDFIDRLKDRRKAVFFRQS